MLTAVALIIFTIEAQIPPPVPIPGVKLGLANIITVYAVFAVGLPDALMIMLVRIFLGGIITGQMMAIMYSIGGGILSYIVMVGLRKILTRKQIWVCSVFAAVAHNIGQILVAMLVTKTAALISYLPVLIVSGIITGIFTGLCAQFVVARLDNKKIR